MLHNEQTTHDPQTLGSLLKQSRLDLGLKLRHVAQEAGITPGHLSRLENNLTDGRPSQQTLDRLAATLQLDAHRLHIISGHLPEQALESMREWFLEGNTVEDLELALNRRKPE